MGLLRTPADIAFSKCIRERSNWTCERCGTKYPQNATGLECSHYHTRGKWGVRFDPLNAEALCTGCHFREGGMGRIDKQLNEEEIGVLNEKANNSQIGREAKKTRGKGEIAKHYREELKRMQDLRDQGEIGRIEFTGYL